MRMLMYLKHVHDNVHIHVHEHVLISYVGVTSSISRGGINEHLCNRRCYLAAANDYEEVFTCCSYGAKLLCSYCMIFFFFLAWYYRK
jgi:hypothetical protein